MVHEVRLTLRKRAYPSQGRVRFNIAHLAVLGIREGEHVELVNESTKKTIAATVMADTVVRPGQVHVSEEDLKTLSLLDDDEILVRKAAPRQEKIKKAAENATTPSVDISKPAEASGKTAARVKVVTVKTVVSPIKEKGKAPAEPATAAPKTVSPKKKPVKKAS